MESHAAILERLNKMEAKYLRHDKQLAELFEAIHKLMEPPRDKRRIGFRLE